MRDSWRQFIASAGWWWWVMIGSYILTGIGAYLDFTGIDTIPTGVWITAGVFAIIISPFMAFHKLRQDRDGLSDKLDTRPSIKAELLEQMEQQGNTHYLKVVNKGAEGCFTAQIEIVSDDPTVAYDPWLSNYYGYWRKAGKDEALIKQGQDDWIRMARVSFAARGLGILHPEICNYDKTANCDYWIPTSSHFLGKTTHANGSIVPPEKEIYNLRVTISSSPGLREGVYRQKFVFSVDGLAIAPNSQSTPDKEVSQTE